jgi:hypothetical protein
MSRERGLEEAGVSDPQTEMKQAMYEAIMQNELQIALQTAQAKAQLQIQMLAMQMQQAQQQAMMMQQQGGGQQLPNEPPPPGIPGAEGQGFNPAMGGQPPAMMQPEATREMQTGRARGGVPVATGGAGEEGVV